MCLDILEANFFRADGNVWSEIDKDIIGPLIIRDHLYATLRSGRDLGGIRTIAKGKKAKNPAKAGFSWRQKQANYLILASLNITCLRTTGSYFLISILPGMLRLFLSVV